MCFTLHYITLHYISASDFEACSYFTILTQNMDKIVKPRRIKAVRVDNNEFPLLLFDYLEDIEGDLYLAVNEFEDENYVYPY